jgi:hypothetical protein
MAFVMDSFAGQVPRALDLLAGAPFFSGSSSILSFIADLNLIFYSAAKYKVRYCRYFVRGAKSQSQLTR